VQQPDEKRRKLEDTGLKRFFSRPSDPETNLFSGVDEPEDETALSADQTMSNANPEEQEDPNVFSCSRCGKSLPDEEEEEHNDWHFAKDLEAQERQAARDNQTSQLSNRAAPSNSRGKSSRGGRGKPEKGQTRLTFG
jgi:DNA polymerase eta